MANIIELSAGRRAARTAPARPSKTKGEIVIFPGVRYERHAVPAPVEPITPVGRKRDALIIPE